MITIGHIDKAPPPLPVSDPSVPELIAKLHRDAHGFGVLPIWTIYDRPTDVPDAFVARLHVADSSGHAPTTAALRSDTLDALRSVLTAFGLVQTMRHPADDPKIVETWL